MSIDDKLENVPVVEKQDVPYKIQELLLYEQQKKYQSGDDCPYEMSSGPSYVDIT